VIVKVERSHLRRAADRRPGPVIAAIGLGLLSSPLAASAIASLRISSWDHHPALGDPALAGPMAVVAVTLAGLIAGSVAGRVVRDAPVRGLLLAIAIAWPVALLSLPIVPLVRGVDFAAWTLCIDSCGEPTHGLLAGATLYLVDIVFGVAVLPLVIPLVVMALLVARRGGRPGMVAVLATLCLVLFYGWWAVFTWAPDDTRPFGQPGLPFDNPVYAFACLVVGAIVWVMPYWNVTTKAAPRARNQSAQ
jgi:hypothetical protein